MKSNLAFYLSKFLGDYLPMQRGASPNTVRTYRDAFVEVIEFLSASAGLKPEKLTIDDFSLERVSSFLDWLEAGKKVSISKRNNRLGALKSFFRFLSFREPSLLSACIPILELKHKRCESKPMNYLSVAAYRLLLSGFDASQEDDLRDMSIISLMYESGGRVSEITGILSFELNAGPPYTLVLHGKGKKTRIVPIDKSVGKLLDRYRRRFNVKDDEPLFFNNRREALTREGMNYILQKHFLKARELHPDKFPATISPHCLRHSRAMHLLENDVNLIYIRDLLGHASVTTTELYSKANPEVKRRHIEKATEDFIGDDAGYSDSDKMNLLNWLKKTI